MPTSPRAHTAHWRRHLRQRGATMVEAALVMLFLMAPFYGLMRFQHQALTKRLEADSHTRMHVAGSASRSCRDNGGNSSVEPDSAGVSSDKASQIANNAGKTGSGAAAVTGKWVSNATSEIQHDINGRAADAARGGRMSPLSGKVNSKMKMACNEQPYDGNIKGWFNFAKGLFNGDGYDNGLVSN